MSKTANILDEIRDTLDERVFDDAGSERPKLKTQHRDWIHATVYGVLEEHGYDNLDNWLSLVFTGSLTTYQYSERSDVDISLFVDAKNFPEWSRAEMIAVMVGNIDGVLLPGTPFPMQCFVVPPDITREQLYRPGLRSGYDLSSDEWIVPPEEDRAIDVKKEMNAAYVYALECADKMERLLRYEPSKAIQFWHQIHKRRRRDQQAGKGDFSNANIVYKFLDNRGLMPAISEVSGEYIASTKTAMEVDSAGLDSIVEQAFQAAPGGGITIRIDGVRPTEGYAFSPFKGSEEIVPIEELKPEHISQFLTANQASWDDPQNYLGLWLNEKNNNLYIDVTQVKPDFDEAYRLAWNNDQESLWDITNSEEIPVRDGGLPPKETSVGRVASPMMHRQVRKWVYDAGQNKLLIGEMGPEEGSLPSHHQLAQQIGLDFITGSYHLGTINKNGWVSTEGGGGKTDNRSRYNAQQALLREASDSIQGFLGGQIELGGSDDKAPEPTWEF